MQLRYFVQHAYTEFYQTLELRMQSISILLVLCRVIIYTRYTLCYILFGSGAGNVNPKMFLRDILVDNGDIQGIEKD